MAITDLLCSSFLGKGSLSGSCLQILEDIQEECGKYGKILSIVVPRPSNPATSAQVFGQGPYGKVGNS